MRCFERARLAVPLIGMALGLGFCGLPRLARAWTLSFDPPRRVDGDTVKLKINYANCPATLDTMVDEAIRIWNGIPSATLRFEKAGGTATNGQQIGASANRDFAVVCDVTYAADTGSSASATLATTVTNFDGTGNLAFGGVILNMETSTFRDETLNQQILVLAHELGHLVGIGHSSDPRAIMYFTVRASDSRPTIGQDDVDAMTFLYPRNELAGGNDGGKLFGCGMIAGSGPRDSGDGFGGARFLSALLFLWALCQLLKVDNIYVRRYARLRRDSSSK